MFGGFFVVGKKNDGRHANSKDPKVIFKLMITLISVSASSYQKYTRLSHSGTLTSLP